MANLNDFTFILNTIYVDNDKDNKFLRKKIAYYLKKIHSDKRRIVVYVCTEPVHQINGKKEGEK